MTFEEIKTAVMNLSDKDKQRLLCEVVPAIWPVGAKDETCVEAVKKLLDEATTKKYEEEHMGNV